MNDKPKIGMVPHTSNLHKKIGFFAMTSRPLKIMKSDFFKLKPHCYLYMKKITCHIQNWQPISSLECHSHNHIILASFHFYIIPKLTQLCLKLYYNNEWRKDIVQSPPLNSFLSNGAVPIKRGGSMNLGLVEHYP